MRITGYTYEDDKTLNIKLRYLYCLDGDSLPKDGNGGAVLPDNINSIKDLFDFNKVEFKLTVSGETFKLKELVKINSFPDYLIQKELTGIYMSGNVGQIVSEFISDYSYIQDISTKLFSNYIEDEIIISDVDILKKISGKPFQLNFSLNNEDYKSILLEEFTVTSNANKTITNTNIYTTNIGFELEKVVDNKKSWCVGNKIYNPNDIDSFSILGNKISFVFVDGSETDLYTPVIYKPDEISEIGIINNNTEIYIKTVGATSGTTYYDITDFFSTSENLSREYSLPGNSFEGGKIELRATDYEISDSRLVLNTKEIELGVKANKFLDNEIIQSIWTDANLNGSYSELFDIGIFSNIDNFKKYLDNNFGNSLTYKTSSFDEWLLKLLEIYDSRLIDNPNDGQNYIYNSAYDIPHIINLINQIDDKWFNMLENVLPSTVIWGYSKLIKDGFISKNKYPHKRTNLTLSNSIITGSCVYENESISKNTNAVLDTVIVEDTTSDVILISTKYNNVKLNITQLSYNQMFGGYYYYGNEEFNFYYNDRMSQVFTKETGITISGVTVSGSSVEYVVEAGKHAACSKEDANNLAQQDIINNGQNYANQNGYDLIYWNSPQGAYYTKSNCPNTPNTMYRWVVNSNSICGGDMPATVTEYGTGLQISSVSTTEYKEYVEEFSDDNGASWQRVVPDTFQYEIINSESYNCGYVNMLNTINYTAVANDGYISGILSTTKNEDVWFKIYYENTVDSLDNGEFTSDNWELNSFDIQTNSTDSYNVTIFGDVAEFIQSKETGKTNYIIETVAVDSDALLLLSVSGEEVGESASTYHIPYVGYNSITHLVSSNRTTNLKYLSVAANFNLSALNLVNLTGLEIIHLSNNTTTLSNIPNSIREIYFEKGNVSNNNFSGLSNLEILDLTQSNISGSTINIGNCQSLISAMLNGSDITGITMDSINVLENIEYPFTLTDNQLNTLFGYLPDYYGTSTTGTVSHFGTAPDESIYLNKGWVNNNNLNDIDGVFSSSFNSADESIPWLSIGDIYLITSDNVYDLGRNLGPFNTGDKIKYVGSPSYWQ